MRRTIVLIGAAVVFSTASLAYSTDITFTSGGTIEDGDTYDHVYVLNDFTVVDMFGGQIGNLRTGNVSTFNLYGGQITKVAPVGPGSNVDIGPRSTINIADGVVDISIFVLTEESYALISGGNITVEHLKVYYDCLVDIKGGRLQINSYDEIGFDELPTINIYGYDFNYVPTWGGGTLTGYLQDDNPFTINGLRQGHFEHFNLIPEPTTFLLLGLGGLLLRKRS